MFKISVYSGIIVKEATVHIEFQIISFQGDVLM